VETHYEILNFEIFVNFMNCLKTFKAMSWQLSLKLTTYGTLWVMI